MANLFFCFIFFEQYGSLHCISFFGGFKRVKNSNTYRWFWSQTHSLLKHLWIPQHLQSGSVIFSNANYSFQKPKDHRRVGRPIWNSFISQAWAKQIILASYLQQNLETLFLVGKKWLLYWKEQYLPNGPTKKQLFRPKNIWFAFI